MSREPWSHRLIHSLTSAAAISLIFTYFGCSDTSQPVTSSKRSKGTPAVEVKTYQVAGAVSPTTEYPSSGATVALLFGGGLPAQFRQARTILEAAPNPANLWPAESFQKLVAALQDQEPLTGALTDSRGAFEFGKPVRPGTYLVTVGIPTPRDVGQQLPKDWPAQLATQQKVTLGGRDLVLPARGAWFADVKVEDSDRVIALGKYEYVIWPQPQPNAVDLRTFREKLQNIERLNSSARNGKVLRCSTV